METLSLLSKHLGDFLGGDRVAMVTAAACGCLTPPTVLAPRPNLSISDEFNRKFRLINE